MIVAGVCTSTSRMPLSFSITMSSLIFFQMPAVRSVAPVRNDASPV